MNKHLMLVRQFHDAVSCPQAEPGENRHLSDMDIVMREALLMADGSVVLKAIKAGDMVQILAGLVNLAYCALAAIAQQGSDITEQSVSWRHDGFVVSLMRLLSDKINACSSGKVDDYSALYCLCAQLSRNFINADFDKAFQMIHESKMSTSAKEPDLSDCLFE